MAPRTVSYRDVRDGLSTGDLVLMQGTGSESEIIKHLEHSPWSHVAMVIRISGMSPPLLWESTPLHFLEDVVLHSYKSGARIVSLDERLRVGRLKELYTSLALRRLNVRRSGVMTDRLKDYIERVHMLPYPTDWELVTSYCKGKLLGEKGHSPSLFCAELVAETYMHMGLLALDHPSNWYTPKDFSSDVQLPLLLDAKLQNEELVLGE